MWRFLSSIRHLLGLHWSQREAYTPVVTIKHPKWMLYSGGWPGKECGLPDEAVEKGLEQI